MATPAPAVVSSADPRSFRGSPFFALRPAGSLLVEEPNNLEIETVCNQYTGHARLLRLFTIAKRSPALTIEALHAVVDLTGPPATALRGGVGGVPGSVSRFGSARSAEPPRPGGRGSTVPVSASAAMERSEKKSAGTGLHTEELHVPFIRAVDMLDALEGGAPTAAAGPASALVEAWAKARAAEAEAEVSRLKVEVEAFRRNSVRESIRLSLIDLASYYFHIGNLSGAATILHRSTKYCRGPLQQVEVRIRMAVIYSLAEEWDRLELEGLSLLIGDIVYELQPKYVALLTSFPQMMIGIGALGRGNYEGAVDWFCQMEGFPENIFTTDSTPVWALVATRSDIALYTTLLVLAIVGHKPDIALPKLDEDPIRSFIDEDLYVSRLVKLYRSHSHKEVLEMLGRSRADFLLDPIFGPHVDVVLSRIRVRFLELHCSAFSKVKVATLSSRFPRAHAQPVGERGRSEVDCLRDELVGILWRDSLQGWRLNEREDCLERVPNVNGLVRFGYERRLLKDLTGPLRVAVRARAGVLQALLIGRQVVLPSVWEVNLWRLGRLNSHVLQPMFGHLSDMSLQSQAQLPPSGHSSTHKGKQPKEGEPVRRESAVEPAETGESSSSGVLAADGPVPAPFGGGIGGISEGAIDAIRREHDSFMSGLEQNRAENTPVDWDVLERLARYAQLESGIFPDGPVRHGGAGGSSGLLYVQAARRSLLAKKLARDEWDRMDQS